jgi:hypothetical protein
MRYVVPVVAVATVVAVVVALMVWGSETASEQKQNDTGAQATVTTRAYDAAFGSFDPVTASGTGTDTVPLPQGARYGVITASYDGSGFFDVGFRRGLSAFPLTSWIGVEGPYHGTVPFGLFHKTPADELTVWAADDGPWRVTISPISAADELPATVAGDSDAVFRYNGGQTSLVMRKRGADRLLVAEVAGRPTVHALGGAQIIDHRSGVVRLAGSGPSVVMVSADGGWTATVK